MPIYEYACSVCDHRLDALQKINDPPLVDCPECGKPALQRLLSAPSFRLKGKGWYETDFKKDNQRNIHGEKEPSGKSDKEAPAKADKPAAADGDKAGKKGGDAPKAAPKPKSDSG